MKKIILLITIPILLSSCFLAITGTSHHHFYSEIGSEKSFLSIRCSYLHKYITVSSINFDKNDSLYIKIKEDFKLMENSNDEKKYYSWRIGDMNFHRKKIMDTIIIKSKEKNHYFILKEKNP